MLELRAKKFTVNRRGEKRVIVEGVRTINDIFTILADASVEVSGIYEEKESLENRFIDLMAGK